MPATEVVGKWEGFGQSTSGYWQSFPERPCSLVNTTNGPPSTPRPFLYWSVNTAVHHLRLEHFYFGPIPKFELTLC